MVHRILHALGTAALGLWLGLPLAAQPKDLPTGERWLQHFREDLLPFWDQPDAWGTPVGDFPTFRCNDGHRVDPEHPCPELAEAPGWIKGELGREYTRMKSRQTYFYGVAFHLTGDPKYLDLARAGATWIRTHALDAQGSAISYWEKGVPGPPALERTSQDLAYANLGLAMVWYLTRDEAVLKDLQRLKTHIFTRYWDPKVGALKWVVKGEADDVARRELVAQLDQVNAYLLLAAPLLPPKLRAEWTADLKRLAKVMVDQYHAEGRPLFWGTVHDPKGMVLGSRHTDFGHTAKALWMLERIGRLTGDTALAERAGKEGTELLAQAFLPKSGSWGSRLQRDGSVNPFKEWWIYAELDQLAATLALGDPKQAEPLPRTAAFWFTHMVDHAHHEVWGFQADENPEPAGGLKIHHWKSGYHSAEHALVGYLTAQALRGEPATLWFAAPAGAAVRPYLFTGQARPVARRPLREGGSSFAVAYAFTGLR